ncbi:MULTISPECIES: hypothetical protein [unclassified Gemella]|uniref:hypothetical protein n=1 Tax=unclassified Gemella TaxID=2624949 RepID=UPI0010738565|nr:MULTISPECIES: hypothetical protein [unclassified Gemella]MBF0710165.1 hypothetical protein [Gemella sp. GL1.1]MBF0746466.1 hypothetical protein [Gemella sp. 19428wG2_WT2a]NYS27509.1 hypothetical protein [Gemella sp. GL1]TFU60246.1 hypothetical protein E4T67_02055 [Gemella sp. WT2a]
MNSKLSEAQKKAIKKWDEKNRERKNYINKRSTARNFIKTMADEDVEEFKKLIEEREKKIKKSL